MTRRQAIIAALMAAAAQQVGRSFQTLRSDELELIGPHGNGEADNYTVLVLDVEFKAKQTVAISIRYKGREAQLSMDEVMDALGAKAARP